MVSQYSETAPHQARATQAQSQSQTHSPFEIQDDQADGETLAARYQMLEELGSGSFGVVYKAIEKATGEIVAIKHVDLESSEEDLSDILSELSVLSSCASPYVTKYRLAFLRRQTLWIVMEYLGGGSCADLLKPPPHSLSESYIAIICRELLLGLAYLHREGKLHRDIKAANILLGMDGRVKLADFGVAAQLVGLKSVRNTFVGTPFWMAPEVIQQEGHDAKADIWSLGITAMELANGEPPHANVHPMKVLFLIPKQPAPRLEGNKWSKDFKDFVALCLTKNVDKRSTAKELLKHRFIRSAGKVEGLQELIVRKQDWEASKGGDRHLKYYAETLKSLSMAQQEDDDWVFETIKAVPTMNLRAGQGQDHVQTQKRRKVDRVSSIDVHGEDDNATRMMGTGREDVEQEQNQNQSPTRLTMRKISESRQSRLQTDRRASPDSPTTARRTARKRISSAQARQPLGVNMSFGNSPSTVRQFRRVSPNLGLDAAGVAGDDNENEDPDSTGSVVRTPSKTGKLGLGPVSQLFVDDMDASLSSGKDSGDDSKDSESNTRSSSAATTVVAAAESKQATLGRRLYATAIGISCQDVLNETADQTKREAVARLAEAFSDLESVDPDGMYHVIAAVVARMKQDPVLSKAMRLVAQNEDLDGRHAYARGSDHSNRGSNSNSRSSTEGSVDSRKYDTSLPSSQTQTQTQTRSEQTSNSRHASSNPDPSLLSPNSVLTPSPQPQPQSQPLSANASRQVTPNSPASASGLGLGLGVPNGNGNGVGGAKLVLAQNNPHLKSHRRRQSAQAAVGSGAGGLKSREPSHVMGCGSPLKKGVGVGVGVSPANVGSPRAIATGSSTGSGSVSVRLSVSGQSQGQVKAKPTATATPTIAVTSEDGDKDLMMDDLLGGLDHTRQLADVLFERWCDGLRLRWPAV